jgi:hypothetical protein
MGGGGGAGRESEKQLGKHRPLFTKKYWKMCNTISAGLKNRSGMDFLLNICGKCRSWRLSYFFVLNNGKIQIILMYVVS